MWLPDLPYLLPHWLSCTKDSHCTQLSSLCPLLYKCLIVLQRCPWGQTQEQPVMREPPNVIYLSSPTEWNWGPRGPPLLAHGDSLITEPIPVLLSPTHSFPLLCWSPLTPLLLLLQEIWQKLSGSWSDLFNLDLTDLGLLFLLQVHKVFYSIYRFIHLSDIRFNSL